jgi:carbonic anhydrase/acetyltransferase-like protein (isoleucine patch superfamily)
MVLRVYQGLSPKIKESTYIDPLSVVIGDVIIGEDSSVWPFASIRGDMHYIRIGERTSIQDNSVLHITHAGEHHPNGSPLVIGSDVTVGHRVILHGCKVEDRVIVGMGSTVLDDVVIESDVILGAGSLVPPGKRLESGFLWLGSPVVKKRPLTKEEIEFIRYSAQNYVKLKDNYIKNSHS